MIKKKSKCDTTCIFLCVHMGEIGTAKLALFAIWLYQISSS